MDIASVIYFYGHCLCHNLFLATDLRYHQTVHKQIGVDPENRGCRKLLIGSRNLGSFCDESRSLVSHVFLSVSEFRIFLQGLGVSDLPF